MPLHYFTKQSIANFNKISFVSYYSINQIKFHKIGQYYHANSCLNSVISSLISALSTSSSITFCQTIHGQVIKSLSFNHGFIGDQLVSKYVKLGCPEDAQNLFDEMTHQDLVSWNSLISAFYKGGYIGKSIDAFGRMRREIGIMPNEVTVMSVLSACSEIGDVNMGKCVHGLAEKLGFLAQVKVVNALINFYGKSGDIEVCRRLFKGIREKSSVSWNSIIAILVHHGFGVEAVRFFELMRSAEIECDEASVLALVQASCDLGLGKLVEAIHGYIVICGFDADVAIATSILNVYAKLGRLDVAHRIFEELKCPDKIACTAMLAAYGMHGCGRESIELFNAMVSKGIRPDHVTFTHLLSACSHSGLVTEGKRYFKIMLEDYNIEPRLDHYSCMVDLLGRAGFLSDAYQMIKSMPMEPNSAVWGALLGACRVYNKVELGKEVAERLFPLDPLDHRNYIMVSNIYSAAGLWTDASKVRALMKGKDLSRTPGCSSIEYGNRIHRFVVGDQSHPESDEIYNKLEEIIRKIRKTGYVPKTEFVLHDVDEDIKEDMINKHSEKLAIAFGLLKLNANVPIIITKNIRICGDCHATAKIISRIEKRTIIIRDSKRFHHFADGICSCGDYW